MPRRFYVTTPIYYVNDVPHLGTAYTTVVADALRRYHLLRGDDAYMLTGTDEHGLKIDRTARELGVTPKAFVDDVSARFRAAWPQLSVEAGQFIRTTDADHVAFVQDFWRKVEANGYLYPGTYDDWYCVGCEGYKTEKDLLPGNLCPLHMKPVERLQEETYFFKLSAFQDRLLALYRDRPGFVAPTSRLNEVVSFVEGGLRDLSVSRTSFTWGIPVPGDPRHVMFVWFDALANYRSALGHGEKARYWPPSGTVVHLVGKDILRFHAVYWPAFLLAAGYREDELPSQVFAHGFLTIDGQKMSKSLRNAVDPLRLARELSPDVLRYHLLRAIVFGQDGDFDHAALLDRYNADLGKNLGNLLSRVLGLCTKLSGGVTPAMGERTPLEVELVRAVEAEIAAASAAWEAVDPTRALDATWAVSSLANQYVDRAAPWALAKAGDAARLGTTLATLLEILRALSVMVWPAMPARSDAMRDQLGLGRLAPTVGADVWPASFAPRPGGEALGKAVALFPVFDDAEKKRLLSLLSPPREDPPAATGAVDAARPAPAAEPADAPTIDYATFTSVDLRVGVVRTAERVPRKDKLLRLAVDLGEPEPRQIVAGLAQSFTPEALVGQRVVVVANLAPRDFGKGLVSHGMLLATGPADALHLATVPEGTPAGSRLK
jgi:methionyl-tRNA synthetase